MLKCNREYWNTTYLGTKFHLWTGDAETVKERSSSAHAKRSREVWANKSTCATNSCAPAVCSSTLPSVVPVRVERCAVSSGAERAGGWWPERTADSGERTGRGSSAIWLPALLESISKRLIYRILHVHYPHWMVCAEKSNTFISAHIHVTVDKRSCGDKHKEHSVIHYL